MNTAKTRMKFQKPATSADRRKQALQIRVMDLPPYITIDEPGDTDIAQLFDGVDLDDLVGDGIAGAAQRRYTVTEILAAMAEGDRAEARKAIKKGFAPVLFVDLLSGAAAIEMRKYTPPSAAFLRSVRKSNGVVSSTMFFKEISKKGSK